MILRPTQQHIAALPPLKPPQITPVFGKKRQIHIIFTAKTQQKRRHQHIPKAENMPDRMHRQLRHLLTLLLHHQCLPLLMQIAALGGNVERVLQFVHGEAPWGLTALLRVFISGRLLTSTDSCYPFLIIINCFML